jgi:hypothetical protein
MKVHHQLAIHFPCFQSMIFCGRPAKPFLVIGLKLHFQTSGWSTKSEYFTDQIHFVYDVVTVTEYLCPHASQEIRMTWNCRTNHTLLEIHWTVAKRLWMAGCRLSNLRPKEGGRYSLVFSLLLSVLGLEAGGLVYVSTIAALHSGVTLCAASQDFITQTTVRSSKYTFVFMITRHVRQKANTQLQSRNNFKNLTHSVTCKNK